MTETRPWGYYNTLYLDDTVCQVKMIVVFPLKRLSLQSHVHRSEHWVIVKGNARMQLGDEIIMLEENQHVYIPKGVLHRIENVSSSHNLEFMETQLGHYLGEDDIIRYDDDFGRK
jgi:hypothetical protein